jgi:hypothetical protein
MSCKPDKQTTDAMHALYLQGFSLSRVGNAFSVTRQTVFKRFVRAGIALRSRAIFLPFIVWNGRKYTMRENGYYASTSKGRTYLHREVWQNANGPIPTGHDVHHIDGNKENNSAKNLALHTASEHGRRHGFSSNQYVFSSQKRPVRQ